MATDPLLKAARDLSDALTRQSFAPPVTHVYDPLQYAWDLHAAYIRRYGQGKKRIVFLGMNPGPYGMAQTGVPFGEIAAVRDYLQLDGTVDQPPNPHPRRPITGLACTRSEVSGRRLWGWIAARYPDPAEFFADHFVVNYCPLAFMEATGRNRTPDQLPKAEREAIYALCDAHLRAVATALQPDWLIGIGHFAESRAKVALAGQPVSIGRISHPSPASPAANRGWEALVDAEIQALSANGLTCS